METIKTSKRQRSRNRPRRSLKRRTPRQQPTPSGPATSFTDWLKASGQSVYGCHVCAIFEKFPTFKKLCDEAVQLGHKGTALAKYTMHEITSKTNFGTALASYLAARGVFEVSRRHFENHYGGSCGRQKQQ